MWRTLYSLRWHIAYLVVVAVIASVVVLELRHVDETNIEYDNPAGEPVWIDPQTAEYFESSPIRIDVHSRYRLFVEPCPCSDDPLLNRFVLKCLVWARSPSGKLVSHWAIIRESTRCFRRPTPEAVREVIGWLTSSRS